MPELSVSHDPGSEVPVHASPLVRNVIGGDDAKELPTANKQAITMITSIIRKHNKITGPESGLDLSLL